MMGARVEQSERASVFWGEWARERAVGGGRVGAKRPQLGEGGLHPAPAATWCFQKRPQAALMGASRPRNCWRTKRGASDVFSPALSLRDDGGQRGVGERRAHLNVVDEALPADLALAQRGIDDVGPAPVEVVDDERERSWVGQGEEERRVRRRC